MFRILSSFILICVLLCGSGYEMIEGGKNEGESCDQHGIPGQCTRVTECQKSYPAYWWRLKICGYVDSRSYAETVVCCPAATSTTTTTTTTTPKPVATTPPIRPATTEYIPPTYDYELNPSILGVRMMDPDGCSRMEPGLTTEPMGIKAWDQCLKYQKKLIFPCEESKALSGGKDRVNHCNHNAHELMVGGEDAKPKEFPHMVLLGYGSSNSSAVWQCGGTLISDRFILTAAHCTRAKNLGYVNYAIVGSLKRTDNVKASQVHRIQRIIKHPDFDARTQHNDIALLETADPVLLNEGTVPACLDVFGGDHSRAVATGWGATTYMGSVADTLQKVTLTKFTDAECSAYYPANRYGATFNSTIQVCYGDHEHIKDSCQGDSGGPLAILNHRVHCMYTVVGITSFGINCGTRGVPGWYTRVAQFVPWIERTVWP